MPLNNNVPAILEVIDVHLHENPFSQRPINTFLPLQDKTGAFLADKYGRKHVKLNDDLTLLQSAMTDITEFFLIEDIIMTEQRPSRTLQQLLYSIPSLNHTCKIGQMIVGDRQNLILTEVSSANPLPLPIIMMCLSMELIALKGRNNLHLMTQLQKVVLHENYDKN